MGTENNGYLDTDQTIINYGIREQRISFAQIIEQDPSYMLRKWLKLRRAAQGTAIGTAIAGAAGVIVGTFAGALPLMGAGLLVSAISGFMIKHHSEGVKAIATESEILDKSHHILNLLSQLERRGANSSELVSLYDRMVRGAIAQRLDVGDPEHLKAFFEREISQSNLAASLLGEEQNRGIASTRIKQPPQLDSAPTPELVSQPVEVGALALAIAMTDPTESAPADEWWDSTPHEANTPAPVQVQPDGDRYVWAKDLLNFPAVLIWGPQGSGKTSFAAWLLRERIKAGHHAWVCDPHKEYGQWNGLKVIGAGMDYEACDQAMLNFDRAVKQAYKLRSEQAGYQPKRETVLVEEFTNWSSRCSHAAAFFAASLSDLRKIKKGVVFVSHDKSLIALGNAQGFSKARNNGLLELELEARIDPVTGEPMPALKGKLKLPGKKAIAVEIATWMNGDMDFSESAQPVPLPAVEAPIPEPEETYQGMNQVGLQADQALKRIGAKIAEKFNSAQGDWITKRSVTHELFNNTDDRNSAKELIDKMVATGRLETEERTNTNGSATTFVRVSRNIFF